jgi:hypothetical protein
VTQTVEISAQEVIEAHRQRLKDAGDLGFAVSQERVPVDRGTLKTSGFPPEFRGEDLVFGYTAAHAEPQEEGTQPYTPPLEPLLRWGDRVFSPDRTADEVLADLDANGWHPGIFTHPGAAVWSKIRSEGLDPQPYLAPAAERMQGYLDTHGLDLG